MSAVGQAVLDVIATERAAARELLKRLDAAEAAIKGKVPANASAAPGAAPTRRRTAASRKGTTAASPSPREALKRREAVHRFIHEQGGKVAPKDVRQALGMSENTFRKAATKLTEAGKIKRYGERQFTRYESIAEPEGDGATRTPGPPPMPRSDNGTAQGRIVEAVQARDGFATLEQIAEATGQSREDAQAECGGLIREEELRMERQDGVVGYALVN